MKVQTAPHHVGSRPESATECIHQAYAYRPVTHCMLQLFIRMRFNLPEHGECTKAGRFS
jgi:hypothetical protein